MEAAAAPALLGSLTLQRVAHHDLLVLELLEAQSRLGASTSAAFERLWLSATAGRLARLRRLPPVGRWRLQEPLLERQTSLGGRFRPFPAKETWQVRARRLGRWATETDAPEPVAMELVAYSESVLRKASEAEHTTYLAGSRATYTLYQPCRYDRIAYLYLRR